MRRARASVGLSVVNRCPIMPADWIGPPQSVFHFRAVQRYHVVRLSSKARAVTQDFFVIAKICQNSINPYFGKILTHELGRTHVSNRNN
jgi:hypothetical protein